MGTFSAYMALSMWLTGCILAFGSFFLALAVRLGAIKSKPGETTTGKYQWTSPGNLRRLAFWLAGIGLVLMVLAAILALLI